MISLHFGKLGQKKSIIIEMSVAKLRATINRMLKMEANTMC